MFGILFSQAARHTRDYYKTRTLPKLLTILGFIVVFAGVIGGLYILLDHGFAFIARNTFFGGAVSLYLYELILLVVAALAVATALIEGAFSLFKNSNELWILSSPGYRKIPNMVLGETVTGGSFLPLLILAIPTLAAMEHVYHIGFSGVILGLLAIFFIIAVISIGTLIVLFVVGKLLSLAGQVRLSVMLTIMVLFVAIVAAFAWGDVTRGGATILFPDYAGPHHTAQISTIVERFEYLPSHPAAAALYDIQVGNTSAAVGETALLALWAVLLYVIYNIVSVWYLRLWQDLQIEPTERHHKKGPEVFPRYFKGPIGALFEKEYLVIVRTGRDFMWLVFMLFLWLLQIGIDVLLRRTAVGGSITSFPFIIQALEVGVIAYFFGAFALRFAFPTMSTERGTAWIVNASPLSLSRVYLAKLTFFASFFGALSIIVALLHSYLLHLSVASSLGLTLISLCIAITITTFAVMMGVLYPNFETTDPQALSTSLPGITLVFLVLIYGALGSGAFLLYLTTGSLVSFALFILVSIIVIAACVSLSLNKLKTFEFGVVTA